MESRKTTAFLVAGLMVIFAMTAATAQAGIITPTVASATSSINTTRDMDGTIDGAGLSGGGTSGDILSETHASTGGTGPTYWLGTTSVTQVLDFTLAAATDVEAVHIWNYERGSEDNWDKRALASFDIAFSTNNGATYSTPISITGIQGNTALTAPIPVQTFTFAKQTGVTDIQLTNLVNHGDSSWYGLAEIRFDTVPEPASLALLGLGGLAMIRRRR